MVKVYIPDNNNNIWVIDANGFNIHIECTDSYECRYLAKVLNEVENNDQVANNKDQSTSARY